MSKSEVRFDGIPRRWLMGTIGITVPLLGLAIWLKVLDIFGLERWTAEQIGDYIHMVVERV